MTEGTIRHFLHGENLAVDLGRRVTTVTAAVFGKQGNLLQAYYMYYKRFSSNISKEEYEEQMSPPLIEIKQMWNVKKDNLAHLGFHFLLLLSSSCHLTQLLSSSQTQVQFCAGLKC